MRISSWKESGGEGVGDLGTERLRDGEKALDDALPSLHLFVPKL